MLPIRSFYYLTRSLLHTNLVKDDFSILGELCYVKLEKLTHSRHLVSLHFFYFYEFVLTDVLL